MKRLWKRLFCILLVTVMCFTMLPVDVFAWKYLSHANSANITWLNLLSYADTSDYDLEIYAPYDNPTDGTYVYKIPDEFRQAIVKYPDAFRAGSLGPDFYPDIVIGQAYIHPYDSDAEVGSGEWLVHLVQSLNRMPQYSEGRLEGLAFTLGFMLHYCGDMFGHDFVNTFSGGTFPSLTDIDVTDLMNPALNNVLSHMSIESYMDAKINERFWAGGALDVDAPTRFVTDSLVLDNNITSGAADIYHAFEDPEDDSLLGGIPIYIDKIVELRAQVMDFADEYRTSTEVFCMGMSSYADQWAQDIDRALYDLVDTFDMIAHRLMTGEKNPDIQEESVFDWLTNGYPIEEMIKERLDIEELKDDSGTVHIILEELSHWMDVYGAKALGVPDIMADGLPDWVDYIFWPFTLALDIIVSGIKTMFSYIFAEVIVASIGPAVTMVSGTSDALKSRLENPAVQLDYIDNPYRPSDNNFEELDAYMQRYAEEQRLLDDQDPLTLVTNSDGSGVLQKLTDSGFEAFYNTMTMFKLILMGPENFTEFIREKTGTSQNAYNGKLAELEATSVKIDVTTYDTMYAGTDDNVYIIVYQLDAYGNRKRIARKLLDNSLENNLEAGNTDTFYIDLTSPVKIAKLEFQIEQNKTLTANGGWKCESVVITPMHAGVELTEPIGVGGNLYMDVGRVWDLEFQKALKMRGTTISAQTPVTHVAVRIKTGNGDYLDGTDYDVYLNAFNESNTWSDRVLLDKYLYNDFEDGDDDVYIVPLAKYDSKSHLTMHPTIGDLILGIEHTADYDWVIKNVEITPYYGTLALTEPITLNGTTLEDETYHIALGFVIASAAIPYQQYPAIRLSYWTALDEGLLKGMKSLDSSMQWEYLPVLWGTASDRRLFFELFKGFRPEIEIDAPDRVFEDEPLDLEISFAGVWNGVGEERRNAVNYTPEMPRSRMPAVEGTATITALKPLGRADDYDEFVIAEDVPISENKIYIDSGFANHLEAGTYHVRVSYTADARNPMYGNTEVTFNGALNVTEKLAIRVKAVPNNSAYGWVSGSGNYAPDSTVVLTAHPYEGYRFKEWRHSDGRPYLGVLDFTGVSNSRPVPGTWDDAAGSIARPIPGTLGSSAEAYLEIPMLIENLSLVAVFEPADYTINVSSSANGCQTTGSGTYQYGESVTVTAQTREGLLFTGWYEDGEKVSGSAAYTFKADKDRDLTAQFIRWRGVDLPVGTGDADTAERGYRIVVDESNDPVRSLVDRAGITLPERVLDEIRRGNAEYKPRVDEGGRFSFAVELEEGYGRSRDFAVKANGEALTEQDGRYTVTGVAGKLDITVEGVIRLEPTPKPIIRYIETDTQITFRADGEGEVILYVNGRAVPNPYTFTLTDKTEAIAVSATAQGKDKLVSEPATLTDNEFGSSVLVPVIIEDSVHGKASIDNKYDAPGTEATLTVTPDAGYMLNKLAVVSDGIALEVTGIDGKYRFTRPSGAAVVSAVFKPIVSYIDVKEDDWFHDDVQYVSIAGLMNGTGDSMFSPEVITNRAMLVTVLWRLEGSPIVASPVVFDDVPAGQWYTHAINWASANGIVNGYGDGRFGPANYITREQNMAILNRYAVYKGWSDNEALPATTEYICSDWAKSNVIWASRNGLMDGIGVDVTDMTAETPRAELAAYLHRFMVNIRK